MKVFRILIFILFLPFWCLWFLILKLRRIGYRTSVFNSKDFHVPIISIGNLSVGGTGKTPLTLLISQYWEDKGLSPLILTRGYKGKLESKGGVVESDQADLYGDEAVLMKRNLKKSNIIVGKNRSNNLKIYFNRFLPDIVLLDDAFQHLKIGRKLNILLFDSKGFKGSESLLFPLGNLREPFGAIKDADIIVLTKTQNQNPEVVRQFKSRVQDAHPRNIPIVEMNYTPECFVNLKTGEQKGLEQFMNEPLLVFCGIGSPGSFLNTLGELNLNVKVEKIYRDHHKYKPRQISNLINKSKELKLTLVTTEKDAVKIDGNALESDIWYLKIKPVITEGEEIFLEKLKQVYL
ncbi:MAG: tetraacyldisaccharide 4'-kinase [Bacteriovoracaceae bacterium]